MWKSLIYQGKEYKNLLVSESGILKNAITKTEYKLNKTGKGYLGVYVYLGSRKNGKLFKIHKAVAETFIPNPYNLPVINHKDGNKLNNRIDNLEWCSRSQNTKHAWDNNLIDRNRFIGTNNHRAKLNPEKIMFIRQKYIPYNKDFGMRALARQFGVDKEVIKDILNKKTWQHC